MKIGRRELFLPSRFWFSSLSLSSSRFFPEHVHFDKERWEVLVNKFGVLFLHNPESLMKLGYAINKFNEFSSTPIKINQETKPCISFSNILTADVEYIDENKEPYTIYSLFDTFIVPQFVDLPKAKITLDGNGICFIPKENAMFFIETLCFSLNQPYISNFLSHLNQIHDVDGISVVFFVNEKKTLAYHLVKALMVWSRERGIDIFSFASAPSHHDQPFFTFFLFSRAKRKIRKRAMSSLSIKAIADRVHYSAFNPFAFDGEGVEDILKRMLVEIGGVFCLKSCGFLDISSSLPIHPLLNEPSLINSPDNILVSTFPIPFFSLNPCSAIEKAVDEGIKRIVARGGSFRKALGVFSFVSPFSTMKLKVNPHFLALFVKAFMTIHFVSTKLNIPLFHSHSLPAVDVRGVDRVLGSVCFVSTLDEPSLSTSQFALSSNQRLYFFGEMDGEMGESLISSLYNCGGKWKGIDWREARKRYVRVQEWIRDGVAKAVIPISWGGLLLSLVKAAIVANIGVSLDLSNFSSYFTHEQILFSEPFASFIIASEKDVGEVDDRLIPIGRVRGDRRFIVKDDDIMLVNMDVKELKEQLLLEGGWVDKELFPI